MISSKVRGASIGVEMVSVLNNVAVSEEVGSATASVAAPPKGELPDRKESSRTRA